MYIGNLNMSLISLLKWHTYTKGMECCRLPTGGEIYFPPFEKDTNWESYTHSTNEDLNVARWQPYCKTADFKFRL
jgi:hypothetical protein